MGFKIERTKFLKKLIPNTRTNFNRAVKPVLKKAITDSIKRGVSPVKGAGRYVRYSDSYKKSMKTSKYLKSYGKKERPINLTVTGKMLRSLKIRDTGKNIVIFFSSKIAKYHDKLGAGASKTIRAMLPQGRETFNSSITKKIKLLLESSFKKATRRNR